MYLRIGVALDCRVITNLALTFTLKTMASDLREVPSGSASELSSPILILRCSEY